MYIAYLHQKRLHRDKLVILQRKKAYFTFDFDAFRVKKTIGIVEQNSAVLELDQEQLKKVKAHFNGSLLVVKTKAKLLPKHLIEYKSSNGEVSTNIRAVNEKEALFLFWSDENRPKPKGRTVVKINLIKE